MSWVGTIWTAPHRFFRLKHPACSDSAYSLDLRIMAGKEMIAIVETGNDK